MATTYAELSQQEQNKFQARLKALGIDPASVPETLVADGTLRLDPNPALSAVPVTTVHVESLPRLKELFGVPDHVFTSGANPNDVVYPAPLDENRKRLLGTGRSAALDSLTPQEHVAVRSAMESYMHGHSQSVPPELVELANTVHFPMQVQVLAAQNIVVTAEFPVSQSITAGTITIQPGGWINVIGDVHIDASVITIN